MEITFAVIGTVENSEYFADILYHCCLRVTAQRYVG